jgi:DNA polymerase I-like protein with 3'-5' exonuclease and polymerase domains
MVNKNIAKMKKTVDMMNEFCLVLIEMERDGIHIDVEALNILEADYKIERINLSKKLESLARDALGDTPFNLSSNDDQSKIIYSRKPLSKNIWAEVFNLGTEVINGVRKQKYPKKMDKEVLASNIKKYAVIQYKTKASQCQICKGKGTIDKILKGGGLGKKGIKCTNCNKTGIVYEKLDTIAGFKQKPSSVEDLAAHGYKCHKEKLESLARSAEGDAKEFITGMVRYKAISHYLSSFINGIKENVNGDGILHSEFMQCVTTTGRLSSRNPNFHNQPRGGTFPIRQCITSRWEGGTITEADYSQLEFRVAAALSKDEVALNDIIKGSDVHQHTADVLTSAGQPTSRQDAKHHTFKPLYGGTSGTKAEKVYYKDFLNRYEGIKKWHKKLLNHVVTYGRMVLPSGRLYITNFIRVSKFGAVYGATKVKNYPVQGFATADIVPLAAIKLHKLYKTHKVKSLLVNEVHDSLVTDTYPGEEELIKDLKLEAMLGVIQDMKNKFNYIFTVPLAVEVKNGVNWLDMKLVGKGETSLSELKELT